MNDTFFDFDQYVIPERAKAEISSHKEDRLCVIVTKEDFMVNEIFLSKILSAIKYDLSSNVRLVQFPTAKQIKLDSAHIADVKEIICFGVSPAQISMNASFRANQIYSTESFNILLTHSLKKLSGDLSKKKALWTALQQNYINENG